MGRWLRMCDGDCGDGARCRLGERRRGARWCSTTSASSTAPARRPSNAAASSSTAIASLASVQWPTVPPADAETIDSSGRTVIPGLIDLHFHIENDPKLALRQLSHGVTSFRDPGQWDEKFEGLRQMIAADGLPGPRIFTTGPHIDGERPAYPADAVVARDPEEARRLAERAVERGATALKIYFRLPFASAKAVIDVCAGATAFPARRTSRCSTRAS